MYCRPPADGRLFDKGLYVSAELHVHVFCRLESNETYLTICVHISRSIVHDGKYQYSIMRYYLKQFISYIKDNF